MPHKRVKKALSKVKKGVKRVKKRVTSRKTGDRLPDLPGPDIPFYGPGGGLAGLALAARVNPYVAAAVATGLGTYAFMENTEKWWGPPVERHAQRTRDRFRQDTSSAIDPSSPWYIPEGYGYEAKGPIGPPYEPVQRVKRKVSKANKATKKAYAYLRKKSKGKMSQKKCCDILKKAAKMASRANPNTPTRIGKGRSPMKTECRKIRKSLWGTNKRY